MKHSGALVLILVVLVFFVLLGVNSCTTVQSTQRGVSVKFGQVQEKEIHAGLNFKVPFVEKIKKYSIEPKQLGMVILPAEGGALTKDNQTVGVSLKVVWNYDEYRILDIAKNFTTKRLEEIVATITEAGTKNVIGTYDIFSLAERQEALSREVKRRMETIVSENRYPLVVVDVQTTNFDWSDEFDRQISLTMNRAQEVKQSQQELEKTKIDSQRQVVEAEAKRASDIAKAEGSKQSAILKAEGENQAAIARAEADLKVAQLLAEAMVVEGKAIAEYNESINQQLGVETTLRELEIEKIRVERWNGSYVPNNMYGPIPVDAVGGVQGVGR